MLVNIKVENMRDAEQLSYICNQFPYEIFLRANKFCADPKSTLGVLAMMYNDKDNLIMDTGDMPDNIIKEFSAKLTPFTVAEEAE